MTWLKTFKDPKNPHAINWITAITLPEKIYEKEYREYWFDKFDDIIPENFKYWSGIKWMYGEPLK